MIHQSAQIHPTAIIEDGAIIAANVRIGAFSYVGADVEIGEGTVIHTHVVIKGPTKIGQENEIYQFASIGEACQDLKYAGEPTRLEIGDRNMIRESVTMHRGTIQDQGLTKVGSDNLFMVNVHIAHDCFVGDHCIFANNVTLGGHVTVGNYAILGGMSAVHQFALVGSHSMMGGGSILVKDLPPYVIAHGNHCKPFGVNVEGLKRRGFSAEAIRTIRRAYSEIYRKGNRLDDAKDAITKMAEKEESLSLFIDFFEQSNRGIIR